MLTISVIIPTHNRATLLPRAIESVLKQSYAVRELLIVDDGSTDDTKAVVEEYLADASVNRTTVVSYIRQERQGPAVARNTGLRAASCDWVAFLDSDDRWLSEKIEAQVCALEQFSEIAGACVTDASYINNRQLRKTAFKQGQVDCKSSIGLLPNLTERIAYGYHGLYLQTLLVNRKTALDVGFFDPSLILGDDSDFLFRLAHKSNVCYVNSPLVEIDRTPNRTNGLIELAREEESYLTRMEYIYKKWLSLDMEITLRVQKRVRWRLQEIHTAWASWHLIKGDYKAARRSMSLAWNYHFKGIVAVKWLLTWVAPGILRNVIARRREKMPASTLF